MNSVPGLTHLTIFSVLGVRLTEPILCQFDQNNPKLEHLKLECYFDLKNPIQAFVQVLDIIAGLKSLTLKVSENIIENWASQK